MYISLKVDLAFKKLFGIEENKDLLISFINSIISETDQVEEIEIVNPYNPKSVKDDRLSVLNIKARSINDQLLNIEINIDNLGDKVEEYDKTALYYWANLYTEELKINDSYSSFNKTIGIYILSYSISQFNKYHNVFRITEKESGTSYFKDLELHTIELKKFNNDLKDNLSEINVKVKTFLDKWIAFLNMHNLLKAGSLPQVLNVPELDTALQKLELMDFNEDEMELYMKNSNIYYKQINK